MHRLALGLGRTVGELRNQISATELDSWALYFEEEPWGALRDNIHAAIIAQLLAAAYRRKGAPLPKVSDFMLVGKSEREGRRERGKTALIQLFRTIAKGKRPGKVKKP